MATFSAFNCTVGSMWAVASQPIPTEMANSMPSEARNGAGSGRAAAGGTGTGGAVDVGPHSTYFRHPSSRGWTLTNASGIVASPLDYFLMLADRHQKSTAELIQFRRDAPMIGVRPFEHRASADRANLLGLHSDLSGGGFGTSFGFGGLMGPTGSLSPIHSEGGAGFPNLSPVEGDRTAMSFSLFRGGMEGDSAFGGMGVGSGGGSPLSDTGLELPPPDSINDGHAWPELTATASPMFPQFGPTHGARPSGRSARSSGDAPQGRPSMRLPH
jgi:hypothetical protein